MPRRISELSILIYRCRYICHDFKLGTKLGIFNAIQDSLETDDETREFNLWRLG